MFNQTTSMITDLLLFQPALSRKYSPDEGA